MRWLALGVCLLGCDGLGHPVVGVRGDPTGAASSCVPLDLTCMTSFEPRAPFPAPSPVKPTCAAPQCPTLAMQNVISGLIASHSNIALHVEQPTTFELHGVNLNDVAIDMRGPVTLRIDGILSGVSIVGEGELFLADSHVDSSAVSLPAGSVRLDRTTIVYSQLAAQDLDIETVSLTSLQASAKRLIGIELSGDRLQLDASDLSLAHVDVTMVEVHRCDDALVVDARLGKAKIGACTGTFRTSGSSFTNGIAQGTIESNGTYWGNMILGSAGANTSITIDAGVLTRTLLCPNVQHLSITSETTVSCVDCSDLPTPELRLCMNRTSTSDAGMKMIRFSDNNLCPLFDDGLPLCQ